MLEVGSVFAGQLRVLGLLGEGGMGSVFLVEQLSTQKRRALKIMRGALGHDAEAGVRFAREARVGAVVDSDHVVEVLDAGVHEGVPWLLMEYLEGETLHARVERRGALDWAATREIMRQLGDGLGRAHAAGLVHRDLKPENIYLAQPRRRGVDVMVKILDFGIAKLVEEVGAGGVGDAAKGVTGAAGTPLWMAPEQLARTAVTPGVDVWALGLIAYRVLTGRYYWRAAQPGASMSQILSELAVEPIEPASVRAATQGCEERLPRDFDAWFARCVDRRATARFADGGRAVDALLSLGAPVVVSAAPTASTPEMAFEGTIAAVTHSSLPSTRSPSPVATARALTAEPEERESVAWRVGLAALAALAGLVVVVGGIIAAVAIRRMGEATPLEPPDAPAPAPSTQPPSTQPPSTQRPGDGPCGSMPIEPCVRTLGVEAHERGDSSTALAINRLGCEARVGLGCTNLGYQYREGLGVRRDYAVATEHFHQACGLGDGAGCALEGRQYLNGQGVDADAARAARLFTQACQVRENIGCYHLGVMHEQGLGGFAIDLAQAGSRYEESCDLGLPDGCTQAARVLSRARAAPADRARVLALRERGCSGGDQTGCNDLAVLLRSTDPTRSRALFQSACERDLGLACNNLADLLAAGIGGPRDPEGARTFRARACRLDGSYCP